MINQIKLAIGLPAYTGQVTAFAQRMWVSMGATLAMSTERFTYLGTTIVESCGIDVVRNQLVAEALDRGADWLLMIDADTWHDEAHDILRMISDAQRRNDMTIHDRGNGPIDGPNIGAVAAQVPKRDPDDTHLMVYRYVDGKRTNATLGPELERIDAAATAMMAINLNFLRYHDIKPPWFQFKWKEGDIKPRLSEDLYFCKLIDDHEGMIFADGRFIAKHLQRPRVIDK